MKGEGKVAEMLHAEGDVIVGINIASIYATSNTELEKLSKEKQKELHELALHPGTRIRALVEDSRQGI